MSNESLNEINNTLQAGFILLAAHAIHAKSKDSFEECRAIAFGQMRDLLAHLARGVEPDAEDDL